MLPRAREKSWGRGDPRDTLGCLRVRRVNTLEVILTASCNLRCSYCYQNAKQGRRMEWDTLRAGLDIVLGSDPPDVEVLFYGGEPLLELPLIERAVAYVDEARRADGRKRVHYVLYTNGMLVDAKAAAFLAEHGFEVQLSFDGVPRAQAARGLGTYDKLDALLDRLRVDHPVFYRTDFRTSITLHSGNLHHLADSVDYFLDKRVARIAFGTLFTHDAGWTDAHMAELDRQFARVFERSLRHYEDTGEVPLEIFRRALPDPRHAVTLEERLRAAPASRPGHAMRRRRGERRWPIDASTGRSPAASRSRSRTSVSRPFC